MDQYREQEILALLKELTRDVSDISGYLKSIADNSSATKQTVKEIAREASRIESKLS